MATRVHSTARILAACVSLSAWYEAEAADYYVSTTGNDSAAGTLAQPWLTLQRAMNAATAGDTVHVRGGVYAERLSFFNKAGTAANPITLRNYVSEVAVIDQTGVTPPNGASALIRLQNCSHIIIQGLELRNYKTASTNKVPIGVLITGGGSGVKLIGNKIHGIWQSHAVLNSFEANAHGILVAGNAATPISGFVMEGNEVYDLRLGASEAVAINGNVTGFLVKDNIVRDCNNIGIDFIGFEGTNSNSSLDVARNGHCVGNTVFNIDSQFNPAYGGNFTTGGGDDTRAAAGIYVDGGANILIEQNHVYHCNFGMEIGCENAGRRATGITVRNNLIRRNHVGGVFVGGYDQSVGGTSNSTITHNTIYQNDTSGYGGGQIALQHNITTTQIKHNIMVCNSTTGQFVLKTNTTGNIAAGAINWNLYSGFNIAWAEFIWNDQYQAGYAAWRSASGQDANSQFVSAVGFTNAAAGDFTLATGSSAINAGDPAFVPAEGEFDFEGRVRQYGPRVDIGMSEHGSQLPGGAQVVTLAADNLGYFSANFRASVDMLGLTGKYWFEYGTTPSLGKKTAAVNVPPGSLPITASVPLPGAKPWKTTYFRVVGQNEVGSNIGSILSFTTPFMPWTIFYDDPVPALVHPGEPVMLTTTALGGEPILWSWRKNGKTIAGANADVFAIAAATTSSAGAYQAHISNAVSKVTSARVPVVVVGTATSAKTINQGATLTLDADFDGPVDLLTYEWRRDGVPLQNDSRISGANKARLTIKQCGAVDDGVYVCVLRQKGAERAAGAITVTIRLRPVMNSFSPSWAEDSPVTDQLSASSSPTKYYAKGLPPGVKLNSTTGALSGTPTASGLFTLKLSASNAAGTGPVLEVPVNVATAGAPEPRTRSMSTNSAPAAVESSFSMADVRITTSGWFTAMVKVDGKRVSVVGRAQAKSKGEVWLQVPQTKAAGLPPIRVQRQSAGAARVRVWRTERGSLHIAGVDETGSGWTQAVEP